MTLRTEPFKSSPFLSAYLFFISMYKIKQLPEDFLVMETPSFDIKEKGDYTYFLLEKRNYNTEHIIGELSEQFRIARKFFGFAGNKDKNAITKQYVSVKGKVHDFEKRDYAIKVVGYGDLPISLGDLKGNRFEIVVRYIESLPKKTDFAINYFDEQRFGKANVDIGFSLLKNDFKKAASLIDIEDVKRYLELNKTDFLGAIKKAPFKTIQMYIHAAQSFLWNDAACEYVKIKSKKYFSCEYSHGVFVFPEKKIENIRIPLLSFDTEFEDKKIEEIYSAILKKHGLSLRDFIIRSFPDITPPGAERDLILEVKNLVFGKLEKDELNENMKKCKVSFELGKGSYATIVIRKMFLGL
jgi:tRNA pseudouridine13 synthase